MGFDERSICGLFRVSLEAGMDVYGVIELAKKHLGTGPMASSAEFCLKDAIDHLNNANNDYSRRRALKSLQYSVGLFHEDYKRAS